MSKLRQQAHRGFVWSAIERFGQQGVMFLVQIVLARILAPEEFGLLAMVIVFVAIGSALSDAGLGAAIIQREKLDNEELSSVFILNLVISGVVAFGLWILAPYVASFYGQPELETLLGIICLVVPLIALGQIHMSQLVKGFHFKKIAVATFPASIIAGGVAIGMAMNGWGVAALIAQALIQHGLKSLFLWHASGWHPDLYFSIRKVKPLFQFGARLMIAEVINQVFRNLYVLVIGKLFSASDVGFYQRAHAFKRMGADNLNSIISRVTFPVLSSIQSDLERMRGALLRMSSLLALGFFQIMAVMAGIAQPLILTLIGVKWLPSVEYLQLLCLAGALYPLHAINLGVLKALGRSDLFLRLEIIKKLMAVGILVITWRYGLKVIIMGQVASSMVSLVLNVFYTRKLLDLPYRIQFKQYVLPAVLAGITFGSVNLVCANSFAPSLVMLCLGLLTAVITALITFWICRNWLKDDVMFMCKQYPRFASVAKIAYGK